MADELRRQLRERANVLVDDKSRTWSVGRPVQSVSAAGDAAAATAAAAAVVAVEENKGGQEMVAEGETHRGLLSTEAEVAAIALHTPQVSVMLLLLLLLLVLYRHPLSSQASATLSSPLAH